MVQLASYRKHFVVDLADNQIRVRRCCGTRNRMGIQSNILEASQQNSARHFFAVRRLFTIELVHYRQVRSRASVLQANV
jgi:hypothetical protein